MSSTWANFDDREAGERSAGAGRREPRPVPANRRRTAGAPDWRAVEHDLDALRRRFDTSQAGMRVGAADDPAEHDADRVADEVQRRIAQNGDGSSRIRAAATGRAGIEVAGERAAAPTRIRRSAVAGCPLDPDLAPRVAALRGHGAPMPAVMRRQMQAGFGADFSRVRIHTGAEVNVLSNRLNARAFTVGSDVFFRGGRPDVSSADGRHLVAHELAHTLQRSPGGVTTVRRVQTPDAPTFEWWWTDAEKTKTYRNYLLTLKWQLMTNGLKKSSQATKVDALIAQEKISQQEVQDLIVEVKQLAPGKPKAAENAELLKADEVVEFERRIARAQELVDGILHSPTAISDGFGTGAGTDNTARTNLASIRGHLDKWKTERATRVSINRSPNAGYVAFNIDKGDNSTLTLADDFFTGDLDNTAGTLIHEASHGICDTTDLGYMDSPYFMKLRDELALSNADNYKYASKLATGMRPLQPINAGGQVTPIQTFQKAMNLCFYKCSKVWMLLSWIKDNYQGTPRSVFEATRKEHETMMELGGDTTSKYSGEDLKPIATQRTIMLSEIMEYLKKYTNAPKTFAQVGTVITVTPIQHTWPTISFDVGAATTVEELAKCFFVQTMRDARFTDDQSVQLFKWCEALFVDMKKSADRRKVYSVSKTDLQLYEILRI